MCWILATLKCDIDLTFFFLLSYSILVFNIFKSFKNVQEINFNSLKKDNFNIRLLINLITIIGIPPFLGFFLKVILVYVILEKLTSVVIVLVTARIIALTIYVRPLYIIINNYSNNFTKISNKKYNYYLFSTYNSGLNIIALLIIFI